MGSEKEVANFRLFLSILKTKFIYEPNANRVIIEMTAALMELVFQSHIRITEDRIG